MSQIDESQRQASELMCSIEKRLVTLFEPQSKMDIASEESAPKQQHQPPSSIIKTTEKMRVDELEVSAVRAYQEESPFNTSKKQHSSGVLNKINKMEQFYLEKIRALEVKANRLECRNEQLVQTVARLNEALASSQQQLKSQMATNQEQVDRTITELSRAMMARLTNETTEVCMAVEAEKEAIRKQLMHASERIRELQDYSQLLKQEKNNLEMFYYNLVENHRRLLKADIERNQASLARSSSGQLEKAQPLKNSRQIQQEKERLCKQLERIRKTNKELKKHHKKAKQQLPAVLSEVKQLKSKLKGV